LLRRLYEILGIRCQLFLRAWMVSQVLLQIRMAFHKFFIVGERWIPGDLRCNARVIAEEMTEALGLCAVKLVIAVIFAPVLTSVETLLLMHEAAWIFADLLTDLDAAGCTPAAPGGFQQILCSS